MDESESGITGSQFHIEIAPAKQPDRREAPVTDNNHTSPAERVVVEPPVQPASGEVRVVPENPRTGTSQRPQTVSAEMPEPEQIPPLSRLKRIANKIFYPSTNFHYRVGFVSAASGLATSISMSLGVLSPETAIPIMIGTLGLALTAVAVDKIVRKTRFQPVTDLVTLVKEANRQGQTIKIGNTPCQIEDGEVIGVLHIEGANKRPGWRKLTPVERGFAIAAAGLDGLVQLGQWCLADDQKVSGLRFFYGKSDLVRPNLFRPFGFDVKEEDRGSLLENILLKLKRIQALGWQEGLRTKVGRVSELWIPRSQLIQVLPRLEQMQARFQAKSSPEHTRPGAMPNSRTK